MFPFEYIPPAEAKNINQPMLLLFDQLFEERSTVLAKENDSQPTKGNSAKSQGAESVQSFGAVSHLDLPRGFALESGAAQGVGGVDERIYRDAQDGQSTIVATLLRFPSAPEAGKKLQAILDGAVGPLDDSQRSECSSFLAKFGDNQYEGGNSLTGYGSQWSAPSYFVRKMEVVEIDGRKVLTVDGAYTPPPWTPKDGLDKAESRFSAAFIIAPGGVVQAVYLEGKPENYKRHENAFVQNLKRAKL